MNLKAAVAIGVGLWLGSMASAQTAAPRAVSHSVSCPAAKSRYLLFAPFKPQFSSPAILLLHGAGDTPENFVETWSAFAIQHAIVLIVPELPRKESFEAIAPAIFRCVADDAKKFASIDASRIYLFGYSMGGYLGFDGAMLDSDYFAAAAITSSDLADDYLGILQKAQRKIPIAIYIGDHDPWFPIEHARKTRDRLQAAGFPVHFVEIKNHDHNYYRKADSINSDAWTFFHQYSLPQSTVPAP